LIRAALGAAVKLIAIIAGAGFGLLQALAVMGTSKRSPDDLQAIEDRLNEVEKRMARAVTEEELSRSAENTRERLEERMEVRFGHQSQSIEALRVMIGQTDELLQRVLDGLENKTD
jgi:hypothetical protein